MHTCMHAYIWCLYFPRFELTYWVCQTQVHHPLSQMFTHFLHLCSTSLLREFSTFWTNWQGMSNPSFPHLLRTLAHFPANFYTLLRTIAEFWSSVMHQYFRPAVIHHTTLDIFCTHLRASMLHNSFYYRGCQTTISTFWTNWQGYGKPKLAINFYAF